MLTCDNCGDPFTPYTSRGRFCCAGCSDEWWRAARSRAMKFYREHGDDADATSDETEEVAA